MRLLFTIFVLPLVTLSSAQKVAIDFSPIDKRVKTIQSNSADSLAMKLTAPYKSELEKVRSIFRWITENIAYDIEGYNSANTIYEGLYRPNISDIDSIRNEDYNDRIVEKVLRERKAICDGYARLFKTLCDRSGILSVIITGYIRWYSDPIGVATNREHAWNAVMIENKWHLLDPTWASGTVDNGITTFTKEYNDFYFLTDPRKMFNNHYPTDPKWALFENPPGRQQFYSYPFFHQGFYRSQIISIKPTKGLIELTVVNRKVRIELETADKEKAMYVMEYPYQEDTTDYTAGDDTLSTEEFDRKYAPKYSIEGNRIYWDYEVQSDKTERLDIMYNDKLILSYRVRMYK